MKKKMVRTTGFGSPAEAYAEDDLDWSHLLFPKPHAMYVFTVQGAGFQSEGVCDGDFILVDCSCDPSVGKLVVASIEGEFCLGLLEPAEGRMLIRSGTESWFLTPSSDITLFGVVTRVVRMLSS